MTPDRWQQVKEVFNAALQREAPARPQFLDSACGEDRALRAEVESLLASHEETSAFLDAPAYAVAAELLNEEDSELKTGQRVGAYEVISFIGRGGMGEVYRARDTRLGRDVAVKILPRSFSADADRLRRFEQEAQAASALNHPNIVTIHEFGEINDQLYIVTEHIDGQTLRQRMKRGHIAPPDALDVAIQLASALAAAHKAGVVHRDIKPENIMTRNDDGIVKVLDFGLAKAIRKPTGLSAETLEATTRAKFDTTPGVVMGTSHYMSPEQARGRPVDERTDIWSLGVVVYEMVGGCLPFEGETTSDVVSAILQNEPPPLTQLSSDANERLDEIVTKCLAKDREKRHPTANDLLTDLKRLRQHIDFEAEIDRVSPSDSPNAGSAESANRGRHVLSRETAAISARVATRASSAEYIISKIRHRRAPAMIAAALLLIFVVVGGVGLFRWRSPTPASPLTSADTILLADFANSTGDTVFDGTLKQGLAVQLGQSPFINIFSESRVRDTLRFMGRSPDERLTRDLAREICERRGLKAFLAGSISALGSHYIITLEAVNARTGDAIAREQVEAASKEQVLEKLGQATSSLRAKLGESLASIQKFDALIEQATTPSLEALKAYALGTNQFAKGKNVEAITSYRRAIELDANFALAHSSLARVHHLLRQPEPASEAAQKAFDLRERVSDYEKLRITSDYHMIVTGDLEKSIETLHSLMLTYPRDYETLNTLGRLYADLGQYEKAVEKFREALRIDPEGASSYAGLGTALRSLNRFEEAKQTYQQAIARKVDIYYYHIDLFNIGFVQGDTAAMQRELEWAKANTDHNALTWSANSMAFGGQLNDAHEIYDRRAQGELASGNKLHASDLMSSNAWRMAVVGKCGAALKDMAQASGLPPSAHSSLRFGLTLALCGDVNRARSLADEEAKRSPKDTWVNSIQVPVLRAAIEIRRGNPREAIQLLEPLKRYKGAGFGSVVFWPEYLRGQAYLALNQAAEAAAEFEKNLDRRGLGPTEPLYPLNYIGLARAAVLMGDTPKAKKSYEQFLELWKNADGDTPLLIQARREYSKLK
ncbi:MAG: protein kinase domain-containing protein [Pyrinomonadaceae bacterium]